MIRVLILDDDPLYNHMLHEQLESAYDGLIEVAIAEDIKTAMQIVGQSAEPFTCFLLDQNLRASQNGLQAMQQLRRESPETESIILTGKNDPELSMKAYHAGAYRYLAKPFEIEELIWLINEIHGIHTINQLAVRAQRATKLKDVADIIVQQSVQIGFERARLYQIFSDSQNGKPVLSGISHVGLTIPEPFANLKIGLDETTHGRQSYEKGGINFYDSNEMGLTILAKKYTKAEYPRAKGELVDLLLYDGEKRLALLTLDNHTESKPLHAEHRRLLRLLMNQAGAALSRAMDYEEERLEGIARTYASKIAHQMGDANEEDSLNRLLSAIHRVFDEEGKASNYIVVLKDKDSPAWVYERMHLDAKKPDDIPPPRWRRLDDDSSTSHVVNHKESVFLANKTIATSFRKENKLKVLNHPAFSWIGVPLLIGEEVIGAIILEHDELENAFGEADFTLLKYLAQDLAGIIQTAWLHERKRIEAEKLHLIHIASEQLMLLAEQRPAWMWHAVLTVSTAGYGFGYDRAVLLLAQNDSEQLLGVMGIGHFSKKNAEHDWEEDERNGMNFDLYLAQLRSELLEPTEIDHYVRGRKFQRGSKTSALANVLATGEILRVKASDCDKSLPKEFVRRFGKTDYAIVPVRAGKNVIGLLLLDNIWKTNPQELGTLDYIDRLTDQAGLIFRNLETNANQIEFIENSYPILAKSSELPLKTSLLQVCEQAKAALGADGVAIYPLERNRKQWRYDLKNGAWTGIDATKLRATYSQKSFTAKVMEEGTLAIDDLSTHNRKYGDKLLRSHPVVKQNGIKSMIAVPIKSIHRDNEAEGILYVDYTQPNEFTASQIRLANSFGELAWLTMHQTLLFQGDQAEIERRDEELELLGELLRKALNYNVGKTNLINLLLTNTKKLFSAQRVTPTIAILEWKRDRDGQPTRVRRQYYLTEKGGIKSDETTIPDKIKRGISGYVLQTRKTEYVEDVKADEWKQTYVEYNPNTRSEIDVPVEMGKNLVGVLSLESSIRAAFTEEHIAMAKRVASTAALALNNVRRQERLNSFAKVAAAASQKVKLKDTLAYVVESMREAMPDLAAMTIWYKREEDVAWNLGDLFGFYNPAFLKEPTHGVWRESRQSLDAIKKNGRTIWAQNVRHSSYNNYLNPEIIIAENIRSSAIFPLRSHDEEIVGVMYFHYRYRRHFAKEEKALYEILAESVAHALNDSLQVEKIDKERQRLEISQRVTEAIGTTVSLERTLSVICRLLKRQYADNKAFPLILLFNDFTHRLETVPGVKPTYEINNPKYFDMHPLAYIPMDPNEADTVGRLVAENVLTGKNLDPVYVANVDEEQHYLRLRTDTRSLVCAPLLSDDETKKHRLLGIMSLESSRINAFSPDDINMVKNIARKVSITVARAQRMEELRFSGNVIGATARLNPILHNVNSELAIIRSCIEQLAKDTGQIHQSEYLAEMDDCVEQILEHVANTPVREKPQSICIQSVCEELLGKAASKKGIRFRSKFNIHPNAAYCFGHMYTFKHAIHDLLRNGLDAIRLQDDQSIMIYTEPAGSPQFVNIYIENNGPPISEDIQPKLFNEIYSSKGTVEGERGVGLLFVRAAIEGMNGRVQLSSSTEEKTSFLITLPSAID